MVGRRGYFLTLSFHPGLLVRGRLGSGLANTLWLWQGTYAALESTHGGASTCRDTFHAGQAVPEILGQRQRPNFRFPCLLGNPALLKREQEAPKEVLAYHHILQVLAIYGVPGKRQSLVEWNRYPLVCYVPHKETIHSGCLVSTRILTEVTFNSDTSPTTAPAPVTPHRILTHIVFQHCHTLLLSDVHSLSFNSNATSLIKCS